MGEQDDPNDNVVVLRFKRSKEDLPTAPVKKGPRKDRPFCTTHFFVYDRDERSVSCSRCERTFDAFEAFEHLAQQWSNYDYNHRDVRAEIEDLAAQRAKVAKQVANLKAQRRRLVPNVRQDVERVRSELWRHEQEKNPDIRLAIMRTIRARIEKVLHTLDTFGDEDATAEAAVPRPRTSGHD